MRWKGIARRITGISTPLFGISWNPPGPERDIVGRVLAMLEDRRVLFNLAEYEYPIACEKSVQEIRRELTEEIKQLAGREETEIAKNLRGMRSACRAFLDSVQKNGLIVRRLDEYPYQAKHWEFIQALVSLRKDFGYRIAFLSVGYGIDIEDGLSSILPPSPDETEAGQPPGL